MTAFYNQVVARKQHLCLSEEHLWAYNMLKLGADGATSVSSLHSDLRPMNQTDQNPPCWIYTTKN